MKDHNPRDTYLTMNEFRILMSLFNGVAKHGYWVHCDTNISLSAIYRSFSVMLKKNYVQEEPPDGTNRRFYRITPVGEKLIQQELEMIGKLT